MTIDGSLDFYAGLPLELVADGWDVHIVSGPGVSLEKLGGLPGVSVHAVPMVRTASPFRDLFALWRWARVVWKVRPDVTFVGTPKAGLLGNTAAFLLRVPRRIYVLHGLRLETSSGISRKILHWLECLTAHFSQEMLCVSESLRQVAIDMSITTSRRAVVLGAGSSNGVDVQRFQLASEDTESAKELRDRIGLDPSIPTIGFVGRLTRDKGLRELGGALRELHAQGILVQMLVVGGIDDDTGRKALDELNRTGQPIFAVGYRKDVAPYFALMDVFCLPSLREGLGTVILEAMASRTVVVATDATGIVDLVHDGETGFLVPRGSVQGLAAALRTAIQDQNLSESLSEAAFAMVSLKYDTKVVQGLLREYLGGGTGHLRSQPARVDCSGRSIKGQKA